MSQVFMNSKNEAQRLKSEFLNTEHLLLGIIKAESSSAREILQDLDADLTQIKRKIENISVAGNNAFVKETPNIALTKMSDHALRCADLECRKYSSKEINTIHLLLGILYKSEDPTTNILEAYDIDYDKVTARYKSMLKESGMLPKNQAA